jgi:phenylalanyl-tRNA synthetase beta chain
VQELLVAAGFGIAQETEDGLTLNVPSNKTDVTLPADIVEEILRIDGLDNIVMPDKFSIPMTRIIANDRGERERIAELLCGMGLQEIITNSIVNSKYYPDRTDLVRMINSLSVELDVMRPSMLESGLEVMAYNCNRKNNDLCLYEFGNVYTKANEKHVQEARLAIWVTGNVKAPHWKHKAEPADLFYAEGLISNLLQYGGIRNVTATYAGSKGDSRITWMWKNQVLCTATQVPAPRLKEFDIKQDVFFAEVHWANWLKAFAANKTVYKEVPKFPAVNRDLAIVLDNSVSYRQVQEVTEQLRLESLQSFGLFDVFESEKLGKGKKSYALSYTFQLQDRTLTDTEIDQQMKRLMDVYKNKLSAQIRE